MKNSKIAKTKTNKIILKNYKYYSKEMLKILK